MTQFDNKGKLPWLIIWIALKISWVDFTLQIFYGQAALPSNSFPYAVSLKMLYDRPLIRQSPDRRDLWSFSRALETALWSDHYCPKVTSDQNIPRTEWPTIILKCTWNWPLPWSVYLQREITSDQTITIRRRPMIIPKLKWPLIILKSARSSAMIRLSQTKMIWDQSITIRNWPLIWQSPD